MTFAQRGSLRQALLAGASEGSPRWLAAEQLEWSAPLCWIATHMEYRRDYDDIGLDSETEGEERAGFQTRDFDT